MVGLVMVIFGFERWYKRVQVYQDAILRKLFERQHIGDQIDAAFIFAGWTS
jgi:hypothetical protein